MILPRKIPISGYICHIRYAVKVDKEDSFGEYDPTTKTITLKKGMSPVQKREVFLHEFCHFLEDIYRIDISHTSLENFARGLMQLLTNTRIDFHQ